MREILFKAKRSDNEEWVEGLPSYDINGYLKEFEVYKEFMNCGFFEVDPNTICQYTGLKDKNGKKIFEGDICQEGESIVRILWNDRYYWGVEILKTKNVLSKGLVFPLWQYDNCRENGNRKLEIIGNIFDNPELIGGTANGKS